MELTAGDFSHAGQASSQIKQMLKQLNIAPQVIKRVVIALYEAEVNVIAHSYGGKVTCRINPEGIEIHVSDQGPGIEDLDLAMTDGFSTASEEIREMGFGAGMGLSNMKNNVDSLDISTGKDSPTKIYMHVAFTSQGETDHETG